MNFLPQHIYKSSLLLLLITFSGMVVAQSTAAKWYLSESNGGLCNHSILLFTDSTYSEEWGCEGSSHFSYGRWVQQKDIINFSPAKPGSRQFIQRIEKEKAETKQVSVMVFDDAGNNITSHLKIGQYVSGKGMYLFETDSSGMKKTEWQREKSKIILISLSRALGQRLEFESDGSTLYKIYLDLPSHWNLKINSEWGGSNQFLLHKKNDTLVSDPDHFSDSGKLVPSIYILQ
jgi:hypothetical protein